MNRTTFALLALLAAALLTLAACGSDDAPTLSPSPTVGPAGTVDPNAPPTARPTRTARVEAGTPPQPCSLIGPSTVSDAIGNITGTQPRTGVCEYTSAEGTLTVTLAAAAANVDAASQQLDEIAGADGESVEVGDEGFLIGDTGLAARKGLYVFEIAASQPIARDALLAMAQEAVGNLPSTVQ